MKHLIRKSIGLTAGAVLAVGLATTASAVSITVDTVLADDPAITTSDATIDMVLLNSTTLRITVANLFNGSAANGLLTGLAFAMPQGADIVSGTVVVAAGSTIVSSGALNGSTGDVSGEWGFRNGRSGHFNDFGTATDTQISAMVADGTTPFSANSLETPTVLDGPEFGLVGPTGVNGGLTAIRNAVVITLTLSRSVNGNFLSGINGGEVAVTYGSPSAPPLTVPDAGSTLALMGVAMAALAGIRRKIAAT